MLNREIESLKKVLGQPSCAHRRSVGKKLNDAVEQRDALRDSITVAHSRISLYKKKVFESTIGYYGVVFDSLGHHHITKRFPSAAMAFDAREPLLKRVEKEIEKKSKE